MYSFRKSKKGFTLIELMVVVVIIGVLALLGLRLYLTQIEKANNALIKANAGTVQTTIQGDLADLSPTLVWESWEDGSLVDRTGIHNPLDKEPQNTNPITLEASEPGEVWVSYSETDATFTINGNDASTDDLNVYLTVNVTGTVGLIAKY
jgi:prepilin-type N-terminal cleavage/methylation domain-containing protein